MADEHDDPPVPHAAESGVHLTYTAATVKALQSRREDVLQSADATRKRLMERHEATHYHTLVAVWTSSAIKHTPYTLLWCLAISIVTCSSSLASGILFLIPK